jgi:hypothetical protein
MTPAPMRLVGSPRRQSRTTFPAGAGAMRGSPPCAGPERRL